MDLYQLEKYALSLSRSERVRLIHTLVESLNETVAPPARPKPPARLKVEVSTEVSIGEAFRQLRAALEKEVVENPIELQMKERKRVKVEQDEAPPRFPLAPGIE